jgi:hypothetical protein
MHKGQVLQHPIMNRASSMSRTVIKYKIYIFLKANFSRLIKQYFIEAQFL